jgi:hypothetical protein
MAYHYVAILHHPRFWHRHLSFGCFPVFVELTVGHRTPLDAELAHVNLVLRVFIIPPKRVVPHIEAVILSLEIIKAKLNSGRAQCDSDTGWVWGGIPDLGK